MFCQECEKKPTCKKICTKLKKHLESQGIRSADFIRPQVSKEQWWKDGKGRWREVPFSAFGDIEEDKNPFLSKSHTIYEGAYTTHEKKKRWVMSLHKWYKEIVNSMG